MSRFSIVSALRPIWQMKMRRRPYVLSHGVNSRCNMQCPFCEYWQEEKSDMSFEEIAQMLDEAADFGIGVYNAWTTEPLLREDLPAILEHAHSKGIMTSLVTNGLLLEKRLPDLSNLDFLSISVDGLESYREIRGIDISRILPGIKKSVEIMERPVLLNCVISSKNVDELTDLVYFAAEIGARISFEPLYEFENIKDDVWENMEVKDREAYRRALDSLIGMKSQGYPIINSLTYLKMVRNRKPSFKCHAPDIILNVGCDGMVETCRVHRQPLADIRKGVENAWEASKSTMAKTVNECDKCLFFGYAENSLLYNYNLEALRHYEWM
ncbi:pyrroloquinoline quinone biosynthesis protein PqqE [Methanohalophilus halophilus]|uniref:Pyrroloquinoline quinone biosynthesis protein PqqE n=2 Tax=Methanohalophilus halophilus TaxID=2177 RepID=A0A1L3Q0T4_9EURY|nr:radical SAM protein [Methanohalophilus halophilus]APH38479.1 pyrroloquinoline quinone biosynthesis protein PqqE [Methanohalophilus halophilus]RNI10646.1 radical SAM protein [Methanohalophilus halophilus]SDW10029.1 Radical SAM superfamily enzyme, MoaA/NifB/PqqE/SkfB family [Methanohalophilus halophilus]